MSLKKIALSSLLLLCGSLLLIQRVIQSNYNISARQLARILNAPAPCQTTQLMNINFLDENDISNYFDSESKLNLPGLGEFKGSNRIKEVIKMQKSSYTEDFDGFKAAVGSKTYTKEDRDFQFLEESTNDECVVAVETVANLKLGHNFKGESTIKTSVNGKLKFKADNGSLIFSEVSMDLPDDLLPTMAGKINPTKSAKKKCVRP